MTEKFLGGVPMKMGGCWIFLSHSGEDIEKVRIIRNEFERYTHNPLAFHLRCLSDETPEKKKELEKNKNLICQLHVQYVVHKQ